MISLKWIKSLTNICWLETTLCSNCIQDKQDLLIMLVDCLRNIMKGLNKFKETGDIKHTHKNELDEGYFAHDAAYSVSKDLVKRTI